jgi:DnaJ like chaperone protein
MIGGAFERGFDGPLGALLDRPQANGARIRAHQIEPEEAGSENAYAMIGVKPGAPLGEIRLPHHRLARETYPGLVLGRGLLSECVTLAKARIARINAAYGLLARRRNDVAAAR